MMQITDVDLDTTPLEQSIVLQCSINGRLVLFLLDSGSTNSFLNAYVASELPGVQALPTPRRVKVAGGGILIRDTCSVLYLVCGA